MKRHGEEQTVARFSPSCHRQSNFMACCLAQINSSPKEPRLLLSDDKYGDTLHELLKAALIFKTVPKVTLPQEFNKPGNDTASNIDTTQGRHG